MRRLFLKTFLWFWLIVILVMAAALLSNIYAQYTLQYGRDRVNPGLVSRVSHEAVDAYERGGEIALFDYVERRQRDSRPQAAASGPRTRGRA